LYANRGFIDLDIKKVKRLLGPLLAGTAALAEETGPAIADTGVSVAEILPFPRHNVQKRPKKAILNLILRD